jgi:hypothetical protein
MKRLLLFFVAFSILNQSIDIDYCISGSDSRSSYDDIDSVYEFLVENFTGDQGYTGEDDNESADPKNSHVQKDISSLFFCQELKNTTPVTPGNTTAIIRTFISFMISKGHCLVVSPPPDPAFSC